MNTDAPVPGLHSLRREREPAADLWPAIEARLKPRGSIAPWAGLAVAASLLLVMALPLRIQTAPAPPLSESAAREARYFAAQLKVVRGAEQELLRAIERQPDAPGLQRLLQSTRERQRQLQQSLTIYS